MEFSHLRQRNLIIFILFLLISSSTHVRYMVEGRKSSKLFAQTSSQVEERQVKAVVKIGSRPPRCERRCSSCGHCEAVQVPAVPQIKAKKNKDSFSTVSMRGDYSSNYKPMSWKCKCGDMIFNP